MIRIYHFDITRKGCTIRSWSVFTRERRGWKKNDTRRYEAWFLVSTNEKRERELFAIINIAYPSWIILQRRVVKRGEGRSRVKERCKLAVFRCRSIGYRSPIKFGRVRDAKQRMARVLPVIGSGFLFLLFFFPSPRLLNGSIQVSRGLFPAELSQDERVITVLRVPQVFAAKFSFPERCS